MRTCALLLTLALLAAAPAAARQRLRCHDRVDEAHPFTITVEGEPATGHYALPQGRPTGLVTFAHGYGHTSASWVEHAKWAAEELGVVALAMDYRGTEIIPRPGDVPTSRGWRVAEGAADTIAAAQRFQSDCRIAGTITNFGVSMGGNTSGLIAAAGATRADGDTPLFDWWVDVEGATNVAETYLQARVLAPVNATAANAVVDIEAEMGGPIEEVPEVYARRSVVTRADDIAASRVRGVVLVHAVDDGLVGHNQSREMVEALRMVDVPTEMYTVSFRDEDSERDTSATGHLAGRVDPAYTSPLAGHASERSTTHVVMETALARLVALHRDGRFAADCHREFHIDGTGTTPPLGECVG